MATIDYNARHAARSRQLVRAIFVSESTPDDVTFWAADQEARELMDVLDLNMRELADVRARVEAMHRADREGC